MSIHTPAMDIGDHGDVFASGDHTSTNIHDCTTTNNSPTTANSTTIPARLVPLKLQCSAAMIAHPQKVLKGGEDAYFVTDFVVGVADGVGGWCDKGIDPSLYANKLMEGCKEASLEVERTAGEGPSLAHYDPKVILKKAAEHSKNIVGSSTACVVAINNQQNCVEAVNVGDSGFMYLRGAKLLFRTREQQHSFNYPFQLGTGGEAPDQGDSIKLTDIEPNDMIIVGTDGLWDNIFDDEIIHYVQQYSNLSELASKLAQKAHEYAMDPFVISPFAAAAQKQGLPFVGGKLDDTTVVVCKLVPCE